MPASPAPPLSTATQHFQPLKLTPLPHNAKVRKRPLHHSQTPSPYASAHALKVVYISARTPFLPAVRRVERLLELSDKRLVQAAATVAKQQKGRVIGKRKHGLYDEESEDKLLEVASAVEKQRSNWKQKSDKDGSAGPGEEGGKRSGEEVVLKATGKAIARALELGLWFQQRAEVYTVRLQTGSVKAIDDIEIDGLDEPGQRESMCENLGESEEQDMDEDKALRGTNALAGTRLRYLSVLEVAVSLK